jgi:transcriptional regulator with XRE-family HTH domain
MPRWLEDSGLLRARASNCEEVRLLAEYALAHGWNSSYLAKRVGRDRTTLSRFLRAKAKPHAATLDDFIKALGLEESLLRSVAGCEQYEDSLAARQQVAAILATCRPETRHRVLLQCGMEQPNRKWPADSAGLARLFSLTNSTAPKTVETTIDDGLFEELLDVLDRIFPGDRNKVTNAFRAICDDLGPTRSDSMARAFMRSAWVKTRIGDDDERAEARAALGIQGDER